jgi:methylated-DNA-[protein]-cysteine S-methyltransferase
MKTYTLIDADGVSRQSSTPGTLGGHRGSRIYGRLDCAGAARAIARGGYVASRVFFADEAAAVAAGYRPCAGCLPDAYATWKHQRATITPLPHTVVESPIGDLVVVGDDDAITEVRFGTDRISAGSPRRDDGLLAEVAHQLREYAAGEQTTFELPLRPMFGGAFERRVWALVAAIPYGVTTTYGELARQLDAPGSARAVGAANGRNPLPLLVPCHRVIGAGGALTGYAGGLDNKRRLLEHEGALLPVG